MGAIFAGCIDEPNVEVETGSTEQSLASCPAGQGTPQCCSSLASPSSPQVALLLGLLGIVVPTDGLAVGLTCSPVGSGSCSQVPACCTNNSFNGLVALGCRPGSF